MFDEYISFISRVAIVVTALAVSACATRPPIGPAPVPRATDRPESIARPAEESIPADSRRDPGVVGWGARPLSALHGSTWLVATVVTDAPEPGRFGLFARDDGVVGEARVLSSKLAVLVYYKGDPGWLSAESRTDFDQGVPTIIEVTLGEVVMPVRLWSERGEVDVQGRRFALKESNVFVVRDVDTSPRVVPIGNFNLEFDGGEDPPVALLRREQMVLKALVDGSLPAPPKRTVSSGHSLMARAVAALQDEDKANDTDACAALEEPAKGGVADAQYVLGRCLAAGVGGRPDLVRANEMFSSAARRGDAAAMFLLAENYRRGAGVERSDEKAFEWYRNAAERNHTFAQYEAAGMYRSGRGVRRSVNQALHYYRWAADNGLLDAQVALTALDWSHGAANLTPEERYKWASIVKFRSPKHLAAMVELLARLDEQIDVQEEAAAAAAEAEAAANPDAAALPKKKDEDHARLTRDGAAEAADAWIRRYARDAILHRAGFK